MSTEITLHCDGYCQKSFGSDIDGDIADMMTQKGWHEDPETVDVHYCPECWIECKKENPDWED